MSIVIAFFPGDAVTIILDNYPPSTLQRVGLGCCKNPRIIVGENSCHFGPSYSGTDVVIVLAGMVVVRETQRGSMGGGRTP